MGAIEIPPDATVFASGGQTYFLYLGAAELRTLQIEWGLSRLPTDTKEEWRAKFVTFKERALGEDWADKVTIIRVALGRWAAAAGNGSGPVALDDARAIEIVDHAELPGMSPRLGPAYRVNALWARLEADMLGLPADEEEETPDPKAKKTKRARRGSAPSGSSPRA